MPADQYEEWKAYDQLEPLDPAGIILDGLTKIGKKPSVSWQVQKAKFLSHIAVMKESKGKK
jgi:hypothetical protein